MSQGIQMSKKARSNVPVKQGKKGSNGKKKKKEKEVKTKVYHGC